MAAADAARRGWAKGAVVDLYSLALELADDDELRRRIRLLRAIALVELADYPRAADELGELLPELEGQERLDALIALGARDTLDRARRGDTRATAEALALAEELRRRNCGCGRPRVRRARRSRCGEPRAIWNRRSTSGDRALERWVPGTRPLELAAASAPPRGRDVLGRSVRTVELSSRGERARWRAESRAQSRCCAAAGSRRSRSPASAVTKRRSRSSTSSSRWRVSSAATRTSCSTTRRSSIASCTISTRHGGVAKRRSSLSAGRDVQHAYAVRRLGPPLHSDPRRRVGGAQVAWPNALGGAGTRRAGQRG